MQVYGLINFNILTWLCLQMIQTMPKNVVEFICGWHSSDRRHHSKLPLFTPLPTTVVVKPPYEVTESGWGEFEVIIKIYFNDPNEKPVSPRKTIAGTCVNITDCGRQNHGFRAPSCFSVRMSRFFACLALIFQLWLYWHIISICVLPVWNLKLRLLWR